MSENKQYILIPFEEGNLIFKDDGREFFNSVDCLKDNEIVDLLNEYELLLGKIKKLCNQNRIPNLLTTYIPVNCEKKKSCLDNHMINASNMGKSNFAKEILKLIGRE